VQALDVYEAHNIGTPIGGGSKLVQWSKSLWCAVLVIAAPVRVYAQTQDAGADAGPAAPGEAAPAPEAPPPTAAPPEPEPVELAEEPAAVEASAAESGGGDDMVVTAQRYEQDVQKTPVAVNAFGQRALDQRGVSNLQDIGKFTPNLQLQMTNRPAGGGSAYAAYIRGIGTGDFQFPTDPGVGLYIDDVYIARTVGGLLSTDADIARIEVIKGPQGTLFGRNTIGGAFNIATSKPVLSGPVTGSALLRFGTYGRHDFAVNVNAPIVTDRIGAKLSVSSQHLDGYGRRILTDERTNDEERFVVRGGALFKLSERLDIRIDADYSRQNQRPPNGQFIAFKPEGPTLDRINAFNQTAAPVLNQGLGLPKDAIYDQRWLSPSRYENYSLQPMHDRYLMGGGSARITWLASDWLQVKSISAVRSLSSSVRVDGDQTPYSLQTSETELSDVQLSQELQFSGKVWDNRLDYMVGLYAFRESGSSTVDTQSFHGLFENEAMPNAMNAADTFARFKMSATSLAAFTQESLALLPELHLTVGARLNHDQKDYEYSLEAPQTGVARVPASKASAGWLSFTPKVGVDYSPLPPVMLYASFSQGFKSGGFGPSNDARNPTPKYNPERVTAYELGVKSHWFEGRKLLANIGVFYNDYQDIQLTVQSRDMMTGANVRTTQNAGRSHIKGFEADVTGRPLPGLALNAGVGYVDAKFASLTPDALMSGFMVGDRLPQIPNWTVNAGAQYAIDIAVGELTLRADVSWRGDQLLTPVDPSSLQEAYAIYSARASFVPAGLEQLELSLYGINLTDTVYYVYRATLPPTGQEVGLAGAPRLIFATARYTF
jgi:iron complex outermembrane receptor protein